MTSSDDQQLEADALSLSHSTQPTIDATMATVIGRQRESAPKHRMTSNDDQQLETDALSLSHSTKPTIAAYMATVIGRQRESAKKTE